MTDTVTLTLEQAHDLFSLATETEHRTPEEQESILILARFLDEHLETHAQPTGYCTEAVRTWTAA